VLGKCFKVGYYHFLPNPYQLIFQNILLVSLDYVIKISSLKNPKSINQSINQSVLHNEVFHKLYSLSAIIMVIQE